MSKMVEVAPGVQVPEEDLIRATEEAERRAEFEQQRRAQLIPLAAMIAGGVYGATKVHAYWPVNATDAHTIAANAIAIAREIVDQIEGAS